MCTNLLPNNNLLASETDDFISKLEPEIEVLNDDIFKISEILESKKRYLDENMTILDEELQKFDFLNSKIAQLLESNNLDVSKFEGIKNLILENVFPIQYWPLIEYTKCDEEMNQESKICIEDILKSLGEM